MAGISIVEIVQRYYPRIEIDHGVDFDGNGKIEGNESLQDRNGNGAFDRIEYDHFVRLNVRWIEPAAISFIQEALESIALSNDRSVRDDVMRSLGRLGMPLSIPFLVAVLTKEKDPYVKGAACSALALIGDPRLDTLSANPDPSSFFTGSQPLTPAFQRDTRVVPAIVARLQDTEPLTRQECVSALGWIGDPATRQNIEPLLKDAEPSVAIAARQALKNLPPSSSSQSKP